VKLRRISKTKYEIRKPTPHITLSINDSKSEIRLRRVFENPTKDFEHYFFITKEEFLPFVEAFYALRNEMTKP